MTARLKIFYPALRQLVDDPDEIRLEGATVGECLRDLVERHPGTEDLLFDARGRLRAPVYVFVNIESMHKASLDRALEPGDELIVAVLATGG